ncbi:MAG: prolyl oligopeptidase family serine peptidase [Thermomicrobiales bacterium]|nr:prolyl oligopeptidase family serine peptidase [Thermomicrobiales bacterium]
MSESYAIDALTRHAASYFDRPSFSAPTFLSDDEIVFLDDRSGTKQASVISLTSGHQNSLTVYSERLLSLKASATSGRIVFGMDAGGNERQQLYTFSQIGAAPARLTHRDDAIHDPGTLSKDGNYLLYRSNAREESTFDILGVDMLTGQIEMWMEDAGQAVPVALTPDGRKAIVARVNGNLDGDLLLIGRGSGVTNLTTHEGEQWIDAASLLGDDLWFTSNLDQEYVSLRRMNLGSRETIVVYRDDSWDVQDFKISPNGEAIAIAINENGASRLVMTDLHGQEKAAFDLPLGVIDQFSWSPDSSMVAFGFSTVQEPSVIMVARTDGTSQVVASADAPSPKTFAPEPITFTTFDGREIPAFWFRPEGEGPFPVLVDIHGGPESQRTLNYSPSGPVLQYLTSLGMGVLSLNVRGSTGYGKSYSHLDDKGLRLDSVKDVAYAVSWLRERSDVDPDRIAVYGRSYGGFMTLASLVFYPDLWAAGVDVVGIANFVSFLERTGPWRRKHREAEYGELENDREMLVEISPLTHIENICVPLMVCHGRNDPRVPLFEAEQVVEAVSSKGLDVVLRVYDDEGHALSKRKNEIDAFVTMGNFLQKHLRLPVQELD